MKYSKDFRNLQCCKSRTQAGRWAAIIDLGRPYISARLPNLILYSMVYCILYQFQHMLHYTRFTIPGTRFCALKSADSCQVSSCCIVWYCVPCHTTQTCATHSVWASFKLQSYHSILGKLPDIKFKIKWNTATAIAALVSLDHLKIP